MSVSPLVVGVVEELARRIHLGDLRAGRSLPSERHLADEFGVSRMVVRSALQELTRRGLIVVKSRCRPIVSAEALRSNGSTTGHRYLAIWLWPDAQDLGASMILKGIQRVSTAPDLKLIVAGTLGTDWELILESESRFFPSIAEDPTIAGAVVWYLGGERNLPALRAVRASGKPLIFVDRQPPGEIEGDFVGTDNENAADDLVQSLVALGHRNIACVTNCDPVSSVKGRLAGYRRALAAANIPFRKEYVQQVLNDESQGVNNALSALLDLREPPTAIFGVNDHTALHILESLSNRGISVPLEMSVVGFDGLLRWVPGGGGLTTARQNFERIGQIAAELCIERIEAEQRGPYRHLLLEAPLMNSSSIGAPRKGSLHHSNPLEEVIT